MLFAKTLAVIGVGKIGGSIISSLVKAKLLSPRQILGSTRTQNRHSEISKRLGIKMSSNNLELAHRADILLLAVKPQNMKSLLEEIKPTVKPTQLVITVAAATSTKFIEKHLGKNIPVIRAMPNLPCLVNEAMTVICPGTFAQKHHVELAKQIFSAVGRVEVVMQEEFMDAVTALSGSGPAYGYIIIESLAEGGVKVGLPRELATTLAAQSLLGAAKMVLETSEHPAKLKDSVTTPAGVTMDGIMELEDGGIRVALIKAVSSATEKSKHISI